MSIPRTLTVTPEWARAQDPAHWLTVDERALCDAASSCRRRAERTAGRLAVKRLILETFGIAPKCYEVASDGIAPILAGWPGGAGITISLSHSAGLGAASWASADSEGVVGVDAQHIRPAHPGLAARVLTPAEQAQSKWASADSGALLFWALKEAAIKARRRSWGRALREIVVTLDAQGVEHGTARIAITGEADLAAWYGRQGNWWVARAVIPTAQPVAGPFSRPSSGQ